MTVSHEPSFPRIGSRHSQHTCKHSRLQTGQVTALIPTTGFPLATNARGIRIQKVPWTPSRVVGISDATLSGSHRRTGHGTLMRLRSAEMLPVGMAKMTALGQKIRVGAVRLDHGASPALTTVATLVAI